MVTAIVIFFILGYLCIALESVLKINKAVPALLMCVVCWTLYACGGGPADGETSERLLHHLGETCEILFFLMGAMTIVEIVDANGGFYFVQDALATKSKRALLWRITFMTFFLSAILDNLTTSIVDNVPLVAGCMEMYPIAPSGDFGVDGLFWQLLAYCAGVGGSMLIIGSAAGVVVMGLEKISFGWYLRRFTWIAFVGYVAGIAVYALETLFF